MQNFIFAFALCARRFNLDLIMLPVRFHKALYVRHTLRFLHPRKLAPNFDAARTKAASSVESAWYEYLPIEQSQIQSCHGMLLVTIDSASYLFTVAVGFADNRVAQRHG